MQKFSELNVGEKFITKNGEFQKVGRTTAKVIYSPTFPQHEGKVTCGWAKNRNVQLKPEEN
tara:strand:- start:474 stop:656 length:183 start_codon:yes stop_codon:yes gene_type:complete